MPDQEDKFTIPLRVRVEADTDSAHKQIIEDIGATEIDARIGIDSAYFKSRLDELKKSLGTKSIEDLKIGISTKNAQINLTKRELIEEKESIKQIYAFKRKTVADELKQIEQQVQMNPKTDLKAHTKILKSNLREIDAQEKSRLKEVGERGRTQVSKLKVDRSIESQFFKERMTQEKEQKRGQQYAQRLKDREEARIRREEEKRIKKTFQETSRLMRSGLSYEKAREEGEKRARQTDSDYYKNRLAQLKANGVATSEFSRAIASIKANTSFLTQTLANVTGNLISSLTNFLTSGLKDGFSSTKGRDMSKAHAHIKRGGRSFDELRQIYKGNSKLMPSLTQGESINFEIIKQMNQRGIDFNKEAEVIAGSINLENMYALRGGATNNATRKGIELALSLVEMQYASIGEAFDIVESLGRGDLSGLYGIARKLGAQGGRFTELGRQDRERKYATSQGGTHLIEEDLARVSSLLNSKIRNTTGVKEKLALHQNIGKASNVTAETQANIGDLLAQKTGQTIEAAVNFFQNNQIQAEKRKENLSFMQYRKQELRKRKHIYNKAKPLGNYSITEEYVPDFIDNTVEKKGNDYYVKSQQNSHMGGTRARKLTKTEVDAYLKYLKDNDMIEKQWQENRNAGRTPEDILERSSLHNKGKDISHINTEGINKSLATSTTAMSNFTNAVSYATQQLNTRFRGKSTLKDSIGTS
ncbi:hypothetical protein [Borrelia sp. P9F1]|uniref:hypothetical protein n=1 Tax=Borrelia sp. P9F1 TaxID=3058374 RepID=UPI002647F641|nr:hypothetical protein [Borrelia sp. P9F1]WKC58459.1 hypothetical protein QYZ68_04590 [Borrelia sp. P9F1]